jgi:hypothetical protein
MTYILLLCQFLLGIVLLLAASSKALQSEQFLAALRLSRLPKILVMPVAILTPIVEACLAVGLVLTPPQVLPLAFAGTLGLLTTFTIWMASVYARKLRVRCGCFGTASTYIGPRSIFRNSVLLLVTLGGLLLSWSIHSVLPESSLWMTITAISLGICFVLLQAFQRAKPALTFSLAEALQVEEETTSNSG